METKEAGYLPTSLVLRTGLEPVQALLPKGF